LRAYSPSRALTHDTALVGFHDTEQKSTTDRG